jgi:hypothetical protein
MQNARGKFNLRMFIGLSNSARVARQQAKHSSRCLFDVALILSAPRNS